MISSTYILEADDSGRQPKIEVASEVDEHGTPIKTETVHNPKFNHKSLSCLRRNWAESGNKEAVQHPVVRMLVSRKWNNFAHLWFCVQASFYVLFPNTVIIRADLWLDTEWRTYFKDPFNYFDWLGLVLTFLVIPLRFAEVRYQWSVAGLGYLFNFLRLFKFSCVTRTTGLYTKTLARIIYRDMTRFSVVFVIVFLGFCGAMFMALKATGSQELFSNYAWLMLAAVRALVEQQPAEEDYSKFSWLSILILLAYMAMVIVILLNILIAQMSYTYSEGEEDRQTAITPSIRCLLSLD
ncbi:hypothetical protein OS493_035014 [Desmophyllum pertusum]|uniref:Ion transport domain-containing protein n=1 Tax=Desmophyllum pertusum TaxID=174260 RepID=A0A9X0CCU7_9CNID|nr:hypothetical protein OS493_035014 [Desmophyllum pertusum]